MKTLFVKTHALGDVLMTTPAIRHAAMQLPQDQFDFLTGRQAALLLVNNPHLYEHIFIDEAALFGWKKQKLLPLLSCLRRNNYQRVCVFAPGGGMLRLLKLASIEEIYAPSEGKKTTTLAGSLPWEPLATSYIGGYYIRLARLALGLSPDAELFPNDLIPELRVLAEGQAIIDKLLAKLSLSSIPLLLVAPGGGHNARQSFNLKRWPAVRFAEVAANLCQDYGLVPVLVGNNYDEAPVGMIWKLWGERGLNLCGSTTLLTLPALINRAHFILCNDSLIMHMAVALRKPFTAIFGPTDPRALLPPSFLANAVTPKGCYCAPCCANMLFKGCRIPKAQQCITKVSVEEVLKRAKEIITRV